MLAFILMLSACGKDTGKTTDAGKAEVKKEEVVFKVQNADVKVEVSFEDDKITAIEIKEHKETDPLGINVLNKVKEAIFKNQFINSIQLQVL